MKDLEGAKLSVRGQGRVAAGVPQGEQADGEQVRVLGEQQPSALRRVVQPRSQPGDVVAQLLPSHRPIAY